MLLPVPLKLWDDRKTRVAEENQWQSLGRAAWVPVRHLTLTATHGLAKGKIPTGNTAFLGYLHGNC